MKPATQKRTTRVKSTDEEVQIFVRNLNGKTMTVMVATSDTVESLLQKVEEKTGIPPSEQRILYAGKQLEPGRILADYNVEKESTLHLGASSFDLCYLVSCVLMIYPFHQYCVFAEAFCPAFLLLSRSNSI